jgi:hypothetical protein
MRVLVNVMWRGMGKRFVKKYKFGKGGIRGVGVNRKRHVFWGYENGLICDIGGVGGYEMGKIGKI